MNLKLPEYLLGKYQLVGTVTFSVLFALVFMNLYIPFSDTAWFSLGDSVLFTITMIFAFSAILLVILSRILMYKAKNIMDITYMLYILWCIAEIVSISLLYTIITVSLPIHIQESGLKIFGRALLYSTISFGVPYIISAMYFAIIDKNNTIRLLNYENIVTDEPPKHEKDMQKISLFDNSGALKFSISPENLFYIESDDNYIKVWYTDSRKDLKQYILRCRLKTVEDSFKGTGLVRCNRKYIVNIDKVSLLHKENEGYVLDLCNEDIPPIPVTKTYQDSVLGYFTEQQPLLEPME